MFGSFARKTESLGSDIDILVRFKKPNNITLFDLIEMKSELEDKTGRDVDIVEEGQAHDNIQNEINKEKVLIYQKRGNMKLGAFSISLSVRDIKASKEFYENLGFTVFAGGMEKRYLIMKNENALIGLFQGMFENNILTFNPGWDENAHNIEKFDDVREIQRQLKSKGLKIDNEVDEKTSGPAGFMITDPDGNIILIDQHR